MQIRFRQVGHHASNLKDQADRATDPVLSLPTVRLEAPIHPYWPIGPIDSLYEKGESGGDADRRDMCVIDGFVS